MLNPSQKKFHNLSLVHCKQSGGDGDVTTCLRYPYIEGSDRGGCIQVLLPCPLVVVVDAVTIPSKWMVNCDSEDGRPSEIGPYRYLCSTT